MKPLEADGWRLELLPELGGAIVRLMFEERDVLRPAAAGVTDPLDTACFPLVPFANRIANGRFSFAGRQVALPTRARFHPHALHGDAWLEPWTESARHDRSVTLQFRSGDGWPWSYVARQTITLGPRQAVIELHVANAGVAAMPAGLGLHPYFPAGPETRLAFTAAGVWLGEPGGIPRKLGAVADLFDFAGWPRVNDAPFIDHCYADWRGPALIGDGDRTIAVDATPNASWAHVYMPRKRGFFCFEPVTHRPDALNAPEGEEGGIAILQPGEALAMSMTLNVR